MKIPFYKPSITILDYFEVFKTLKTGWLTTGKRNSEFTKLLSEYLEVEEKNLKLVSSCTAGLHLLFDAFEVKGYSIIIPSITFISPVEMSIISGAKPIIVDVEDEYLTISLDDIERKITKDTKIIVPTYYGGNPYDIDGMKKLSESYDIIVIEDGAHAFGTEYMGSKVGNTQKFGTSATVFSLYATKTLQTGEGGLISTHLENIIEKISKTYLHGMDKNAWKRYQDNLPFYDITEIGFKYNFPDILASIGIAQLKSFNKSQKERERVWNFYQNTLNDIEGIRLPKIRPNTKHSYHLFVIRLNLDMWKIDRNTFIKLLNEKGIGTSVHFTPVYRFSKYQSILSLNFKEFPISEKVYREIVSLPIYPSLSNKEIWYIVDTIKDIWKNYRR
ncbi:MAG: DegT/DnrJ/EryC1/StrS aminotransferase family protein [Brevinematales bacterium]|nr:DegT/DnrJ/EryC1/StrS aminotransferase family protein [Brevinematales bacterium]